MTAYCVLNTLFRYHDKNIDGLEKCMVECFQNILSTSTEIYEPVTVT